MQVIQTDIPDVNTNKEAKDTPSSVKESSVDRKWSPVQARGISGSSPDLNKIRRKAKLQNK